MPGGRKTAYQPNLVMPLSRRGVRGVTSLGRYQYTMANPGLTDHSHPAGIEICFLVKGAQTYRLAGQDYRLQGGDVFVTLPDESHSTGGLPQEKGVLYWMILEVPANARAFLGLPPAEASALLEALRQLPGRLFRGSWKMKEHLDAITRLFAGPATALTTFAMANHVGAYLLEVIRCGHHRPPSRAGNRPLAASLDYIARHLDEPISVPLLAAKSRLSVARFKARFKQDIGIPPGEYVLRAKIKAARDRLKQGEFTVTQVAYDLGFSSSQYFATVFKRFTGTSPSGQLTRCAEGRQDAGT